MRTRTSDEVPPVMICTRFGVRIRDRGWLAHRLELISSITAPSLLAQPDQNFSWVILIDEDLPGDVSRGLEDMLEPFGKRAFLHPRPPTRSELSWVKIARDHGLSGGTPFLLTAKLDDDDAWCTSMVRLTRERVGTWLSRPDRGRAFTFFYPHGLEWVMYEMLDVGRMLKSGERLIHPPAVRRWDAQAISLNRFVCAPLSDRTTVMGPERDTTRHRAEDAQVDNEVVQTADPMWLCCRHKQTGSSVTKANGPELDWSLPDLTAHFGLKEPAVQDYLDRADEHQYAIVQRPTDRRSALLPKLRDVRQQIEACGPGSTELPRLNRRRDELQTQIERLETNLLGDPER